MQSVKDISKLAAAIESIQYRTRPGDGSPGQPVHLSTGWVEVDRALGGGLRRGAIHEWFAAPAPHLAIPPLAILVHLAWRAIESTSHANASSLIIWIGRRCWPHPRAMTRPADAHLLDRSLFIDPPDDASRVWAIDLALRSSAACAVIADGSELDIAATRRLQLAAETGGTWALLTRPRNDLRKLSSATTRWIAEPHTFTTAWPEGQAVTGASLRTISQTSSPKPHTFPPPRWTIELLRCKGVRPILPPDAADVTRWALELNHVTGALDLHAPLVHRLADTA